MTARAVDRISPALIDWQTDEQGLEVPVSRRFGDVYFSRANGLAETRHVFLAGNELAERLATLLSHQTFCIGELGFGTGLNVLAAWHLWRKVRPANYSRLHIVSVEKFPLSYADIARALAAWPALADQAELLLAQYPPPIAGPHRLIFADERVTLDLWLGDAVAVLPQIEAPSGMDAWFLDGFAPSCNPDLWGEQVLSEVVRLSRVGTTFASFTVAGVVKRGLRAQGITVTRPRGFGQKREMLKAWWPTEIDAGEAEALNPPDVRPSEPRLSDARPADAKLRRVGVVGSGIAGLSVAWALALRGHEVRIYDQAKPLAGASGNPRALLVPKLTTLAQAADHLPTLGWLSSRRWWGSGFGSSRALGVLEPTAALTLASDPRERARAADYPAAIVQTLTAEDASRQLGTFVASPALLWPLGALVSPSLLAEHVLSHSLIQYETAQITAIQPDSAQPSRWQLVGREAQVFGAFDDVIVTAALQTQTLVPELHGHLRPVRGQVSWTAGQAPRLPLTYGGYCASVSIDGQPQLLLGASFDRGDAQDDLRDADHTHNRALLAAVAPDIAPALPECVSWQGRASVRAQTRRYAPFVGAVGGDGLPAGRWVLAGLGSKGFAVAPLAAELVVAQLLGEVWPVSRRLGHALRPPLSAAPIA